MAIKGRNQYLTGADTVGLVVTFKDMLGVPIDTDSFPQITIITPSGTVAVGPTSLGVSKIGTGRYQFNYLINITSYGIFSDNWLGYINGSRVEATYQFIIAMTDMPANRTDGYEHLGDDVPFDYSPVAIHNINKLLKTLRARLRSRGKVKVKDASGNDTIVECDIFDVYTLVSFLANGIAFFNEIPHFTAFNFDDTPFIDQFHEVIVESAVMNALQGQALLETGAVAGTITDNGVNFNPPNIGEMANGQFGTIYGQLFERVKFIKNSFKPYPMGLGRFDFGSNGNNPAFAKLRHLREKQII